MEKIEIKAIGDMSWTQFREFLVQQIEATRTEEEFHRILLGIKLSIGTKKELNKARKELGLPKI